MKHLFTLLVVCFTIYSTAQDISKLEKEAKKIVVAIQKEDVNSFKKLIVSRIHLCILSLLNESLRDSLKLLRLNPSERSLELLSKQLERGTYVPLP